MDANKAREIVKDKQEVNTIEMYKAYTDNYAWAINHINSVAQNGKRSIQFSMSKLHFGTIQRLLNDGYYIEDELNRLGEIIISW